MYRCGIWNGKVFNVRLVKCWYSVNKGIIDDINIIDFIFLLFIFGFLFFKFKKKINLIRYVNILKYYIELYLL